MFKIVLAFILLNISYIKINAQNIDVNEMFNSAYLDGDSINNIYIDEYKGKIVYFPVYEMPFLKFDSNKSKIGIEILTYRQAARRLKLTKEMFAIEISLISVTPDKLVFSIKQSIIRKKDFNNKIQAFGIVGERKVSYSNKNGIWIIDK